jgi:hypothetical protein
MGFTTSMNDKPSFSFTRFIKKNEWHSIEVKQQSSPSQLSIFIDGEESYRKTNFTPKQFDNVSGYICSDDAYECGIGEYKNIEIDFGSCTSK